MHTHRVESFLIYDNVRLEIVHESNPFFAGEPISLIIRLKHLGSQKEHEQLKNSITEYHKQVEAKLDVQQKTLNELTQNSSSFSSWSLGSLLKTPFKKEEDSSATITRKMEQLSMDEETFKRHVTTQLQFHNPVNLISGYIQISGLFQYNLALINDDSLNNKGTKIVGVVNETKQTLPKSLNSVKSGSVSTESGIVEHITKYSNSNFEATWSLNKRLIITPDPDSKYIQDQYKPADSTDEFHELPLFLIPQTLLFTEVTLQPGEVKTFHFKSATVPKDTCPTYGLSSNNVAINYKIEFGVNIVTLADMIPFKLKIPLFMAPYVGNKSQQYTMVVDKKTHIMPPATIKEISNQHSKRIGSSSSVFSNSRRRSSVSSSFFGPMSEQDNNSSNNKQSTTDPISLLRKNFVDVIKDNVEKDFDIDQLVEKQLDYQFQENETTGTDFDEIKEKNKGVTRENISNLKRMLPDIQIDDTNKNEETNVEEGLTKLVPQLNSGLQKKFVVNRDGKLIAKIRFSKLFYTISDEINLVVYPEHYPELQMSAVKVSLQCAELFNKNYVLEKDQTKPYYKSICDAHGVCFDKSDSIPLKLIIPRTPMNQLPSQFKTNIFEIKWVLSFTFILLGNIERKPEESNDIIPPYNGHLDQFYEDNKGVLYHSKENVDGTEFSFKVPINILPSSTDFAGW